jgi:DNA-binding GntR family transcriptional regulator
MLGNPIRAADPLAPGAADERARRFEARFEIDRTDQRLDHVSKHIVAWLEARGVEVCYADTTITAQSASKGLAGRLDVPAGAPQLFMEEVGYGPQDERVFYSHDFYRCDLTRFRIVRRRNLP